jgi:hypothetical protein
MYFQSIRDVFCPFVKFPAVSLLTILTLNALSQNVKPEVAVCKIQINNKNFELKPNSGGYFQRIANIEKNAIVPVEVAYPNGNVGDKIVLTVLDGGSVDSNKAVAVVPLDGDKKCVFNFHVTNQVGLFRVLMTNGEDQKIVQVWVGAEPVMAKH